MSRRSAGEKSFEVTLWDSTMVSANLLSFLAQVSPALRWRKAQPMDFVDTLFTNTSVQRRQGKGNRRSSVYRKLRLRKPKLCYSLCDLWEFYDRPFGLRVTMQVDGVDMDVYFTPALSSIEVYGYEALDGEQDGYSFTCMVEEEGREAEEGNAQEAGSSSGGNNSSNNSNNRPRSNSDLNVNYDQPVPRYLAQMAEQSTRRKRLVVWNEARYPNERPRLVQQIEELSREQSDILTKGNNMQIHPDSWYSVVWSPVPSHSHSLEAHKGVFLTFHRFHMHGDEQRHSFWYSESDLQLSQSPKMHVSLEHAQEMGLPVRSDEESSSSSSAHGSSNAPNGQVQTQSRLRSGSGSLLSNGGSSGNSSHGGSTDEDESGSEASGSSWSRKSSGGGEVAGGWTEGPPSLAQVFLEAETSYSVLDTLLSMPAWTEEQVVPREVLQQVLDEHGECGALSLRNDEQDSKELYERRATFACGLVGAIPYKVNLPLWCHFVPEYSNFRYVYAQQRYVRYPNQRCKRSFRGSVFMLPTHLVRNGLALQQHSAVFHNDLNHYSAYVQALMRKVTDDPRLQKKKSKQIGNGSAHSRWCEVVTSNRVPLDSDWWQKLSRTTEASISAQLEAEREAEATSAAGAERRSRAGSSRSANGHTEEGSATGHVTESHAPTTTKPTAVAVMQAEAVVEAALQAAAAVVAEELHTELKQDETGESAHSSTETETQTQTQTMAVAVAVADPEELTTTGKVDTESPQSGDSQEEDMEDAPAAQLSYAEMLKRKRG